MMCFLPYHKCYTHDSSCYGSTSVACPRAQRIGARCEQSSWGGQLLERPHCRVCQVVRGAPTYLPQQSAPALAPTLQQTHVYEARPLRQLMPVLSATLPAPAPEATPGLLAPTPRRHVHPPFLLFEVRDPIPGERWEDYRAAMRSLEPPMLLLLPEI